MYTHLDLKLQTFVVGDDLVRFNKFYIDCIR